MMKKTILTTLALLLVQTGASHAQTCHANAIQTTPIRINLRKPKQNFSISRMMASNIH